MEEKQTNQADALIFAFFRFLGIKSIKGSLILAGLLAVVMVTLISSFALWQINESNANTKELQEVQLPSVLSSYRLIDNNKEIFRLYQAALLEHEGENNLQKSRLEEMWFVWSNELKGNYLTLDSVSELAGSGNVKNLTDSLGNILTRYREQLAKSDSLMKSGANRIKLANLHYLIENTSNNVDFLAKKILELINYEFQDLNEEIEEKSYFFSFVITGSSVLATFLLIVFFVAIYKNVANEIEGIVHPLEGALKGEDTQLRRLNLKDFTVLNDPLQRFLAWFKEGKNYTALMLENKGEVNQELEPLGPNDFFTRNINKLEHRFNEVKREDELRAWNTSGLAMFVEILRNQPDLDTLAEVVLSELVKYVEVNQGALFVVHEDEEGVAYLKMASCYAYERLKYQDMKIRSGQGLVGQVYLEKKMMHLKKIPEDYVYIRSGLGHSNPNSMLLMPLIINEEVVGVIELASFEPLEPYKVEFLEKLGETIASSISGILVNDRTRKLLEESREQTEQLRSQEEEMRQNMEELSTTQEQMNRKEMELQKMYAQAKQNEEELKAQEEMLRNNMEQIMTSKVQVEHRNKRINAILDTANDAIITINDKGIIDTVNKQTLSMFGYEDEKELIGNNVKMLMPEPMTSDHDSYIQSYLDTEVSKIIGSSREVDCLRKDGTTFRGELSLSEVELDKARIFIGFVRDIEEKYRKGLELQEKNEQLLAAEEELRQNMEEVRAMNEQLVKNQKELKESLEESRRKEREQKEQQDSLNSMMEHTLKSRKTTEAQRKLLDGILNSSRSAILLSDENGALEKWNTRALELFQADRTTIKINRLQELVKLEEEVGSPENLKEVKEDILEKPFNSTAYTIEKNKVPARISLRKLEHDGESKFVCFVEDISTELMFNEELEQAYEEIKAQEEELRANLQSVVASIKDGDIKALTEKYAKREEELTKEISKLREEIKKLKKG